MVYCPRCGVEIDAHRKECPLCGATAKDSTAPEAEAFRNYPEADLPDAGNEFAVVRNKRFFIWELFSIFFGISLISVVTINWGMNRELSWALYPVTSVVMVWGVFTVVLFLRRFRIITVVLVFSQISLFLWFLDYYTGGPSWVFPFTLRILSLLFVTVVGAAMVISGSKTKGLNILGIIFVGISLFCGGLENILSLHFTGGLSFTWSLIVGFSLIPAAGFTMYLHYRFTSGKKLGGWFHL